MQMKKRRTSGGSIPGEPPASSGLVRIGDADVDLTSWHLSCLVDCDEDFSRKVLEAASEAISLSLQQGVVAFAMPDGHADKCSGQNPNSAVMYLEVPFGTHDMENPVWAFSLSDAIRSWLTDLNSEDACSITDKSGQLLRIRGCLSELVLGIDQALTKRASPDDRYREAQ